MEHKINNIAEVLERTGMSKSHARQMAENIHSTGDAVHKDFEDRKEEVTMNTGKKRDYNPYEKERMKEMRQEALEQKPIEVSVDYETPDKPLSQVLEEPAEVPAEEFQEPEPVAEIEETSYDEHEDSESEPAYEEPVEEEAPIEVPEIEEEPEVKEVDDSPEAQVDLSNVFNVNG